MSLIRRFIPSHPNKPYTFQENQNRLTENKVQESLGTGVIVADMIAANAIVAGKIAANAVTAGTIAAGAVVAASISVSQLSAIAADMGTLTAGIIQDAAVKFKIDLANVLLTVKDNQGSPVTRVKLGKTGAAATDYGLQVFDQAGATIVDINGLGANTVNSSQIVAGSVITAKLADGGIILDKLSGDVQYIFAPYREDWTQAYSDRWTFVTGTPTVTQPQVTDSEFGGKILRVLGSTAIEWNKNIPFDKNVLYRVKFRIRQIVQGGTAAFYGGVSGVAANGTTRVNINGADSIFSQHYFAVGGVVSTGSTWSEYVGYFKGSGGSPGNIHNDPESPGTVHADVRYFRPILYLNNTGSGTDQAEVDMIEFSVDALSVLGTAAAAGLNQDGTIAANKVLAASILAGAITAAKLEATMILTNLLQVNDTQGSPVTRVKLGKVGLGTTDYGLQIWDSAGAVVADFTGSNRILAVPVYNKGDDGGNVAFNFSNGLTQQVRLIGSNAVLIFQNPTNGGRYRIWFQQDTLGNRTVIWPENVMFVNDTPPVLTTTPGAMDLFEMEYRSSPTARYTCIALQTNVLIPSPSIQGTVTKQAFASSTTHNVTMPATVTANDLLLMFVSFSGASAKTTPSGWTAVGNTNNTHCYAKVADGTEDGTNVNVATGSAESAASMVWRITRWYGALNINTGSATESIKFSGVSAAPSTTPDPPQITPAWTNDRCLWLAVTGYTGNPTISAYPTNYANGTNQNDSAAACAIASADRRGFYASTDDPSTFTLSSSQTWAAFTVAIRPPA